MTHAASSRPRARSIGRRALFAVFAFVPLAAPGCLAGSAGVDETGVDDGEAAITRAQAVARADQWVNAELHYCQSPNHQRDYDTACSSTCNRHDNASWNPYRSDCSGLVSWAWGLPAPGRTTYGFSPYQNDITRAIDATDLEPGDAVNNDEHVMLFKNWIVKNHEARFIEEPGCSASQPYAREVTSSVSISGHTIHVAFNGMTFTAIRFTGLTQPSSSTGGDKPAPKPAPKPETQHWYVGDFDGDGKSDYAKFWDDEGDMSADVHGSTGSSFVMERFATKQGAYSDKQHWLVGDFNGDGKTDFAKYWNDGGEMTADVHLSTGNAFAMHRFATKQGGFSDAQHWRTGDFDGDGKKDLAKYWNDGGQWTVDVHLSTGKAFEMHRFATQEGGYWDAQVWVTGDFDGDGKTDFAKYWNDGGQMTCDVHLSRGDHFEMQRWATKQGGYNANQHWVSGDFDGDGRTDLAKYWNDGGQWTVDVHLSRGDHFEMHRFATKEGGYSDTQHWFLGDFNGDGKLDFAKWWDDGGKWTADVHLSSGSSFSMHRFATKEGGVTSEMSWHLGDFAGTGRSDFSKFWSDADAFTADVHLSSGSAFSMHRWATREGGLW